MPFSFPLFTSSAQPWDSSKVETGVVFDGSADYMTRTFSSDDSSGKGIVALWFRRIALGAQQCLISGSSHTAEIEFLSDDTLRVRLNNQDFETASVFRDSAWYHLLVSWDTAQSGTDKVKIYINGVEVTDFDAQPTLSADPNFFDNTLHRIGGPSTSTTQLFDGVMSQVVGLPGVSIQNSDYAITDFLQLQTYGTNGSQYVPRADSNIVAYATAEGGNAFCLTADIGDGTDASTNSNDFTPTSMSQSANGTPDTPSNPHAIWNRLDNRPSNAVTVANGGLAISGGDGGIRSTLPLPTTGKVAMTAVTTGNDFTFGIGTETTNMYDSKPGGSGTWVMVDYTSNFAARSNNVDTHTTTACSNGDKLVVCYDADTGKLWLGRDTGGGVSYLGGGDPAAGTTPTYTISTDEELFFIAGAAGCTLTCDFGQNGFDITMPTGYNTALTESLRDLTLSSLQGADCHQILGFSGTGADLTLTGAGFESAMALFKTTSGSVDNRVMNNLRSPASGDTELALNATSAEGVKNSCGLDFNGDGIEFDNDVGLSDYPNNSGTTDIVYLLKGDGTTGAANSDGGINSTVIVPSHNAYSFGTYAANSGVATTVGHGLPAAPEFGFIKSLDGTYSWIGFETLYNGCTEALTLEASTAPATSSTYFNDTDPTATVFSIGTAAAVNNGTDDYLFGMFRSVPGVLKVGTVEGFGNADGPFVYCGFKPRFLWLTRVSGTGHMFCYDTQRSEGNPTNLAWVFGSTAASVEATHGDDVDIDIYANGFRIRNAETDVDFNTNIGGSTYLYVAFADIAGGGEMCPVLGR